MGALRILVPTCLVQGAQGLDEEDQLRPGVAVEIAERKGIVPTGNGPSENKGYMPP